MAYCDGAHCTKQLFHSKFVVFIHHFHSQIIVNAELPEEPYDSRSLFERLKEQRDKKDLEYEETHKLSMLHTCFHADIHMHLAIIGSNFSIGTIENMIRGLDDDEVDFLSIVDQAKMDAERRQQIEENKEMRDFRERVATLQENTIDQVCVARAPRPRLPNLSKTPILGLVCAFAYNCPTTLLFSCRKSALKGPCQKRTPPKRPADHRRSPFWLVLSGSERPTRRLIPRMAPNRTQPTFQRSKADRAGPMHRRQSKRPSQLLALLVRWSAPAPTIRGH